MKCFVTGANGFIGANLVQELLTRGHRVKALIRPLADDRALLGLKYERVTGDILDRNLLEREMRDCEWCFHVAGDCRIWTKWPALMQQTNVEGTRTVLAAAGSAGCARIVHTSTALCIGLPPLNSQKINPSTETDTQPPGQELGHYVRTKFEAEAVAMQMFRKNGFPVIIVNPTMPIGPGDWRPSPTGKFVLDCLRRRLPLFTDAGMNWVHVRDVASGHILAAVKGSLGHRYILGNKDGNWTLPETFTALQTISGVAAPTKQSPLWLAQRLAEGSEIISKLTGREPRVPLAGVELARHKLWFNPAKAIRELNLPQTPPTQAFQDAVLWFRANGFWKG